MAGTHREEEKNKNILTGRKKEGKKKNILDTHRPSHGRTYLTCDDVRSGSTTCQKISLKWEKDGAILP
jgi:hypothetical protein